MAYDYSKAYLTIGGIAGKIAKIPKSSLIAYNLEQMHEILTLNFFRFIDKLTNKYEIRLDAFIANFYVEVDKLSDEKLLKFLIDLQRHMTDTAEFNFYGAHQIDFSTIISISVLRDGYEEEIHLPQFIRLLSMGNIAVLDNAQENMPELFQSYRFLDYLLEKVDNLEVRDCLLKLRKQCKTPDWVPPISEFPSEPLQKKKVFVSLKKTMALPQM